MFGYRPLAESMVLDHIPGHTGSGASGGGWPEGPVHPDILDATAIRRIFAALPPDVRQNGRQIDEFHWKGPDGRIYALSIDANGNPTFEKWTEGDSADFLKSVASGGSGSGSGRLASDDPRYWANLDRQFQLELAKLGLDAKNIGLDSESARRQLLAQLIANRDDNAIGIANLAANIAKTQAEFAANPRDTFAEGQYRLQTGGVPFGDIRNERFKDYQAALTDKQASMYQNVGSDMDFARGLVRTPPPVEFFGPEIRTELGLPPNSAQELLGGTGGGLPASTATAPTNTNGLQSLMDRLNSMSEADKDAFRKWTTATAPRAMAHGGTIDFESMFADRSKPGFSPSSSEGGTNLNIHERAVVVGESGQVYATLGEKRPDGTMRAEQLQIKPLKSEVEKDKKLQEAGKAITETRKQTMASFAEGGQINFGGSAQEKYDLFEMLLKQLGGTGGGSEDPFGGARHLAGIDDEILDDPYLKGVTEATYSKLGVRPEQLWAGVAKYRPQDARYVGQTTGRVNYL